MKNLCVNFILLKLKKYVVLYFNKCFMLINKVFEMYV